MDSEGAMLHESMGAVVNSKEEREKGDEAISSNGPIYIISFGADDILSFLSLSQKIHPY